MNNSILLLESGFNRKYRTNLALARYSTIYKEKGYKVYHAVLNSSYIYPKDLKPDKIIVSATFSFDLPYLKRFMDKLIALYPYLKEKGRILFGGVCTYYMRDYIVENFGVEPMIGCSYELDHVIPDFDFGEKESSYLFTQRGCNNGCSWCVVPKLEKNGYTVSNWKQQIDMRKKHVVVYDNNILSTDLKHRQSVFQYLEEIAPKKGIRVEGGRKIRDVVFDSGFDFRHITEENLELIKNIKFSKIRVAWDSVSYEKLFDEKMKMLLEYFPQTSKRGMHETANSNIECYVLYNCPYTKDTLHDTLYRAYKLRYEYGIFPYLMRYQPLNTLTPKTYLSPYWDGYDAKDIARWANDRSVFMKCENYKFYSGRKSDGKCLSVSNQDYLSFVRNFSNRLAIDFSKKFEDNLSILSKELQERTELLNRFNESQLSFI